MGSSVLSPEVAFDAALGETARSDAELDAAEEFPAQLCTRLDAVGLPAYYVPAEWGGALDDHERLMRLWRIVARRDLSALVAHGKTYLGTASVWIAGSPVQAAATAATVLSGAPVAWALSEPEHGADLLSGSCSATRQADGWRLDGTKWPINNASRAGHLTVLARTGPAGTARGHSLFLVDKSTLARSSWTVLPKVPTHGIRGVDISGLEFDGAELPAASMIGAQGTGVETVLRSLQLTRTMCAALSLGAGEHALRLVARFTATRVTQRHPLLDRPYPRAVLARCAALLAAVEAAALVGSRSIHSLTREMSVTSVIVKGLAPALTDSVIADLAELLGARSLLTEVYADGAFQKVWRDHQIVAVFDGSTPVNRASLVQQFPRLANGLAAGTFDTDGLAEAIAVGIRPRRLDRSALTLMSRQGCSVVQSLPTLAESLAARQSPAGLAEHATGLSVAAGQVGALMTRVRPAARPPMAAYELAAAYELCYAGAACLHLWAAEESKHADEPLWEDGLWVRAALRALRTRLAYLLRTPPPPAAAGDDQIDGVLSRQVAAAAESGAPITPFGPPMPRPIHRPGNVA